MNFEIFDNFFQIAICLLATVFCAVQGFRLKNRGFLILSLSYASFMMGTLYYVSYLVLRGEAPQVFYVAEIAWISAYIFLLSLAITRKIGALRWSWVPALVTAIITALAIRALCFGPSPFTIGLFALTVCMTSYLSLCRIRQKKGSPAVDALLVVVPFMQVALYAMSSFVKDYTRFNPYFLFDMLLTLFYAALSFYYNQEVKQP